MQGKRLKSRKKLAFGDDGMYKFDNGQISLEDFGQPIGMNLKNSNRWVKRAQTIPWLEIEKKYAKLFSNKKGNVAKSLRLGLGARIIQAEYGYSDAETPLQIQENPYLQYFCGYKAFDDSKPPFDPSMMVYFRKRLTPEIIGEINEMIISAEQAKLEKEKEKSSKDESDDDDKNSGTMIVDATCAPSQISYPQDVSLLNKARECSEKIIEASKSPVHTVRKRIKTTLLTPASVSQRQSNVVRQSKSSLAISTGTSVILRKCLSAGKHYLLNLSKSFPQSKQSTRSRKKCTSTAPKASRTGLSV